MVNLESILIMRKGTTLIEIVIAVLILAVAFIPILRLVDYGSVNTTKIGNYARATRLAQELIEECKHIPFKAYKDVYGELGDGQEYEVAEDFYKETKKSIDKFMAEEAKNSKQFFFETKPKLKVYKNEFNQIKEVWFFVEMTFFDRGNKDNGKGGKRTIKVSNAYHNPEAIY